MPEILHEATVRLNEQTLPWREGLTLAALLGEQQVNAEQVATLAALAKHEAKMAGGGLHVRADMVGVPV